MYDYLDRAPSELAMPARLSHMSLRLWAKEVREGRCPMATLRELFTVFGVPGALWPAHNFYSNAFGYATRPLAMGCPCCGRVTDDEALLLSVLRGETDAMAEGALKAFLPAPAIPRVRRAGKSFNAELQLAVRNAY